MTYKKILDLQEACAEILNKKAAKLTMEQAKKLVGKEIFFSAECYKWRVALAEIGKVVSVNFKEIKIEFFNFCYNRNEIRTIDYHDNTDTFGETCGLPLRVLESESIN